MKLKFTFLFLLLFISIFSFSVNAQIKKADFEQTLLELGKTAKDIFEVEIIHHKEQNISERKRDNDVSFQAFLTEVGLKMITTATDNKGKRIVLIPYSSMKMMSIYGRADYLAIKIYTEF